MAGIASISTEAILNQLRDMQSEAKSLSSSAGGGAEKKDSSGMSFTDHLKQNVQEVNQMHQSADKMAMEVATGKSENLHETMLASTQAEIAFNLMVQVRNKALEAYMEIMRMPV